ncbi:S-methyl-5-thioribose-1-phosphate isomerase [Methylovorus mays]|uniref:S-methyl-5-thioribose-1-phosphate isomerase n=1 Tax=Methylovorus mays TaxID=184077 RepID=UPI001E5EC9A2|nr:S-methyl-5-thioribose-1-phosphate isomerase [Methylovorus mays]MCB5207395.1 S-methyl-5-thioribose-1-phosphate isomerase [Methylovorus mays]
MKINQAFFRTIWPVVEGGAVEIIDQTQLPHRLHIVRIANVEEMVHAIKHMQVRGAPLIGAAAAYGMALGIADRALDGDVERTREVLLQSRPTAVNLRWAVQRMQRLLLALPVEERAAAAWREAAVICDEDVALNQAIGQHGLGMLQALASMRGRGSAAQPLQILTHCNAGWLATVDWGTALAPIYAVHEAGLAVHVWVDETRPRNQGAALTAWELAQHGVPHTIISDNAGGHLMQRGEVDCVIVGADRVTATGDVCNKIGTYLKALAACDNDVPFYAAVPSPTIDWGMQDGVREIPIEERDADEVHYMQGVMADGALQRVRITPPGSAAANPAFDVTPARLVTGIITERGIASPAALHALFHTSD